MDAGVTASDSTSRANRDGMDATINGNGPTGRLYHDGDGANKIVAGSHKCTYDPSFTPSSEEILAYGRWLGIAVEHEKYLLRIAKEGLKAPLPLGWQPRQTEKGEVYYYNSRRNKCTWEHPLDFVFKQRVVDARAAAAGSGSLPADRRDEGRKVLSGVEGSHERNSQRRMFDVVKGWCSIPAATFRGYEKDKLGEYFSSNGSTTMCGDASLPPPVPNIALSHTLSFFGPDLEMCEMLAIGDTIWHDAVVLTPELWEPDGCLGSLTIRLDRPIHPLVLASVASFPCRPIRIDGETLAAWSHIADLAGSGIQSVTVVNAKTTTKLSALRGASLSANALELDVSDVCDPASVSFSEELSTLTNLQKLMLRHHRNIVVLPTVRTALQSLDLSGCIALRDVQALGTMPHLRQLNLTSCSSLTTMEGIDALEELEELTLTWCKFVKLDRPLTALAKTLKRLTLQRCDGVVDLTPLSSLAALEFLDLGRCKYVRDLSPLAGLPKLGVLLLDHCSDVENVTPLGSLPALHTLDLSRCNLVLDLAPLSGLPALTELRLSHCLCLADIAPLALMATLQRLSLRSCREIKDFSPLSNLSNLVGLDMQGCIEVIDLSMLVYMACLTDLNLSGCPKITDTSPLGHLHGLQVLNLSSCGSLQVFDGLEGMAKLQRLDLTDCLNLTHFSTPTLPVSDLRVVMLNGCRHFRSFVTLLSFLQLERLGLRDCHRLGGVKVLEVLDRLQYLDIRGCSRVTDLTPLLNLPRLVNLNLSHCSGVTEVALLVAIPSLECVDLCDSDHVIDRGVLQSRKDLIVIQC